MQIIDRADFPATHPMTSGDHACLVFDDADERITRVTSWVRTGLDLGERVVFVEPPGKAGQFARDVSQSGLDLTRPLRDGQLVLLSAEDALLAGGDWDVERRIGLHEAFVRQSVRDGFPAVRMGAEAAPALGVIPGLPELRRYEEGMEALTLRAPVSVLCLYERKAFGSALGGIALAHPRGIGDRQMRVIAKPGHVTLVGEVDISNTELMGSALDEAVPIGGRLVLDLAGVSFIDVGGTTRLVELARRLGGPDRVRIVGAPPQLRRILAAAEWQDEMDISTGGVA